MTHREWTEGPWATFARDLGVPACQVGGCLFGLALYLLAVALAHLDGPLSMPMNRLQFAITAHTISASRPHS